MTRKRHFRFSPLPVTAFLLVFLLLLWLGNWQLGRGYEKRALHDAFASTAVSLSASDMSFEAIDSAGIYSNIELRGRYLGEYQFLLDNMTSNGQAGYHVLTPFAVSGKDWIVIVDRGWVPKNFAKDELPAVNVNDDERLITGKLSPLPQPGLLLEGEMSGNDWPKVTQFASTATLAEYLPTELSVARPAVLLAADEPGGFERDWQPPGLQPERHFAYAFQWFALALTLFIIFFVVAFRGSNEETRGSHGNSEES